MQSFFNSMHTSSSAHRLLANDNQHEEVSHSLLANGNEICEKSKVLNQSNNDSHEINNNNVLNDDLNDEDTIIVDKEVSIIDVNKIIVDKEDCESEVEEDDSIADENVLQNKMIDHYLDKYDVIGKPFLSSYIKYTSNTWKIKIT